MTSKLTQVYDNLGTAVATVLAGYKRVPNPYVVAANNQLYLSKAYGLAIGTGQRRDLSVGPLRGRERIFSLVLVNQMTATDHDLASREAQERALVEDFLAVETALERNPTLDGPSINVLYQDDSGIDFLATDGGKFKYIALTARFLVLYEENLT